MEVFEAYPGMYQYEWFPLFAEFIFNNYLEEFVREQLRLSYKLNVPLLLTLSEKFSDEQLIAFSTKSNITYLRYIINNQSGQQIQDSMERWLKDQLEVIGKFQITAEDITLLNFVRGQAFKKFIPFYASEVTHALLLSSEIDRFLLGTTTTATNIYINLLKEKIEEESNFSSKLVETSPAVTFVFDLIKNKEVFVSGKAKDVMGYTPKELMDFGDNALAKLSHPEDLFGIQRVIQLMKIEKTDTTHQFEYRFLHKDENYRWLRTYIVVFKRDNEGKPIELLGKTFEINQEKKTAIALQKRENQLLEAQSLAHIGSYEWDFVQNNSQNTIEVYKIFEMEKQQKYEEFMSYVHPNDIQKVKDCVENSFRTGHYECEYRYIKNGKEKVIWSLGKVEFEKDKPAKMVGTVQDITQIKIMEKELIIKTNQLEQSNESLQQFAYIASHDLKEPLRKINMFTDIVLETENEKLSASSKTNLWKVQSASNSMRTMVEDILSFSVLEAVQEKNFYSLKKILDEVIELLDQSIQEKGGEIIADNLPEAYIIPSQFRQLFQNLISNSLKFSKKTEPPKITISHVWLTDLKFLNLKSADKYLELTFIDNGIGFSNEFREKVFDLFKRLHSKKEYEGSGLGLAIVKKIVQNHEGIISAESKKGEGACFKIVIPVN